MRLAKEYAVGRGFPGPGIGKRHGNWEFTSAAGIPYDQSTLINGGREYDHNKLENRRSALRQLQL